MAKSPLAGIKFPRNRHQDILSVTRQSGSDIDQDLRQECYSEFGSNKERKKRLLARILEEARKRLSRQNLTKKCVNVRKTSSEDMQVAGYAQFEKNWAV